MRFPALSSKTLSEECGADLPQPLEDRDRHGVGQVQAAGLGADRDPQRAIRAIRQPRAGQPPALRPEDEARRRARSAASVYSRPARVLNDQSRSRPSAGRPRPGGRPRGGPGVPSNRARRGGGGGRPGGSRAAGPARASPPPPRRSGRWRRCWPRSPARRGRRGASRPRTSVSGGSGRFDSSIGRSLIGGRSPGSGAPGVPLVLRGAAAEVVRLERPEVVAAARPPRGRRASSTQGLGTGPARLGAGDRQAGGHGPRMRGRVEPGPERPRAGSRAGPTQRASGSMRAPETHDRGPWARHARTRPRRRRPAGRRRPRAPAGASPGAFAGHALQAVEADELGPRRVGEDLGRGQADPQPGVRARPEPDGDHVQVARPPGPLVASRSRDAGTRSRPCLPAASDDRAMDPPAAVADGRRPAGRSTCRSPGDSAATGVPYDCRQ